jgi:hypothetical protein
MAKAKDSNNEAGGTEKRKIIKSIKAEGLVFPETISALKLKATKTKSKKKEVILVNSSLKVAMVKRKMRIVCHFPAQALFDGLVQLERSRSHLVTHIRNHR